jgi:chromosome segregation ATPase
MIAQEKIAAVRKQIEELKTLRDEIRLDVHLARMDLRDEWTALEKRLPPLGDAAEKISALGQEALATLAGELKAFRDRLARAKAS